VTSQGVGVRRSFGEPRLGGGPDSREHAWAKDISG
jgi:hypothetical protein